MVNCPGCSLENDDSFSFCVRCGKSLRENEEKPVITPNQKAKECPKCGARVPFIFRFCGDCGYSFGDSDARNERGVERRSSKVTSFDLQPASGSTGGHRAVVPPIPKAATSSAEVAVSSRASVPRFVVIRNDGTEGESIPLKGPVMTLGRTSKYASLSGDHCLSPEHIIIREQNGEFEVSDADSLNGVFVGVGTEMMPLEHGDQLRFGRQLVEFRAVEKELARNAEKGKGVLRIGSENVNYWGLLSVISHPKLECQVIPIVSDICIVGREQGDIRLSGDYYVSGRHLEIRRIGESYFVCDLNSSNGTYIRLKHPHIVKPNEKIMMGQQLFVFRND